MTGSAGSSTGILSTGDPIRSVELSKGRTFVLTLGTGEPVRASIEKLCSEKGIICARLTVLGGVAAGSSFVTGPMTDPDGDAVLPLRPIHRTTSAPTEFSGVGTVFPDENGRPVVHLHGVLGREGGASAGCFRGDVVAWLTLEVVIDELTGSRIPVRGYVPELDASPLRME